MGGLPLNDQNLGAIRAMVGLVFQNPDDQLFSPRVYQDVAFGPLHMGLPEDEVRARVERALAAVKMSGYAERMSYHLSLGEKKRIAVATVLSMEPRILVLDEPSAGLDPRARRDLIQLLARPGRSDHADRHPRYAAGARSVFAHGGAGWRARGRGRRNVHDSV